MDLAGLEPATSWCDPRSLAASWPLTELRERGQDRNWLQAVVDYLHDREALRELLSALA